MFELLAPLPADPILGLMALYQKDPNPNKVDLGVGIYKNEAGQTPVLKSIKQAEQRLLQTEITKAYLAPAGHPEFNTQMASLLFGENHCALRDQRLALVQTPGGCGALRAAAELIRIVNPNARIWVSDPTWGNHIPLLGSSGLNIATYPYFDPATGGVKFDEMMATLSQVGKGDLVLLHACCHNPTGADLSREQWQAVAQLAQEKGFTPFVDMAYQGFGEDLAADAYGLRLLAETLPEVIIAASCSKNFGLYRERVGVVGVVGRNSESAAASKSHILSLVRGIYSMPPAHGALLVAEVLSDAELKSLWLTELTEMRERIQRLRSQFVHEMNQRGANGRFDFVNRQTGMFSFLGLSEAQVSRLQHEFSVYLVGSSRASIAGLNEQNIGYVCDAVGWVSRAAA
jgi:aspartate aminotransferase